MRITCNVCGYSGSVREENSGKTVRCKKCRSKFVVGSSPAPATPDSLDPTPPKPDNAPVEPENQNVQDDFVVDTESSITTRASETPIPPSQAAGLLSQLESRMTTGRLVTVLAVLLAVGIGIAVVFVQLYSKPDNRQAPEAKTAASENAGVNDPTETFTDDKEREKAALDHLNRGLAAAKQDDLDRAIAEFTAAIRLQPNAGAAYHSRASCYRRKGDTAAALADANQAIHLDPKDAEAYAVRAAVHLMAGKYSDSIRDCNSALALNPDTMDVYVLRGDALLAASNFADAVGDYSKVVLKEPGNAVALRKRAVAYLLEGNKNSLSDAPAAAAAWEKAIRDCNEALRLSPDDAATLETRCRAYFSLGKTDNALADAGAALRLNSKNWLAYQLRGLARQAKEERKEAVADFTEALQLNPKDSTSLRERGIARFYLEDYQQAAADLTAALREQGSQADQPKYRPVSSAASAEAYYYRGRVSFTDKKYDTAIADFTAAIKADPRFARAYFHRSLALAAQGHKAKAKRDHARAIELGLLATE
jgi:tetratricopeptide (TPR) repeat protein